MSVPLDLKAVEKAINRELEINNIQATFTITSYNPQSRGFTYNLSTKPSSAELQPQAQAIVDRHLKEYRASQPNFVLFHRR